MTVYIKGASKAALNRELKAGATLQAREYNRGGIINHNFKDLPDGTAVKVYSQIIQGNPYAKSYGQVKGNKIS